MGARGAEWVRALESNLVVLGSNPAAELLAIPFIPLCQCIPEETLKAVGPFYLVSMSWEVKDPTTCRGLHILA